MEPRNQVQWFAEQMEITLRRNDHKIGWQGCSNKFLLSNLEHKARKLQRAIGRDCTQCQTHHHSRGVDEIIRQATNVANYAMMIADNANQQEEGTTNE